jgi:hypothetical protein
MTRQRLVGDDAAFLQRQLGEERIRTLLLNGAGVVAAFSAAYGVSLRQIREVADRKVRCKVVAGVGPRRLYESA